MLSPGKAQASGQSRLPCTVTLALLPGAIALTLLPGCSLFAGPRPAAEFLTSNEAQGSVVVQAADCKGCKPASRTFYVVSADQLKRVRGASSLTYLGTDAEHHFFRAWNKLLEPPEVDHVAVPLTQCAVTEPRSLDDEHAAPRERKLDPSGASCAVH
jgi:hypothetical protein